MAHCPRARHKDTTKPARFLVAEDPAVQEIARMVVAGIDRRYDLHPRYEARVQSQGKEAAEADIRDCVEIAGACDLIQTEMDVGGIGLFGGLSDDGTEFIFYEWTSPSPVFRLHMTHQDARDIVSGAKRFVKFLPCTKEHFDARNKARGV
ncbi:hypothetical protein HY480_00885 [Candidatus Uhrbacteria bacterium]|nr:hypothetical protein [Candidatus Uhrbacteria bacterium]